MSGGTSRQLEYVIRHPVVKSGAVAAVAMILLTVGVAAFIWWPAVSERDQMTHEVSSLRVDIGHAINRINTAENFYGALTRANAISEKLGAEASQADLTDQINQLAAKLGIKILNESNEERKIRMGYLPMFRELSIQGDYVSTRKFLLALRQLPTWTTVQELHLTKKNMSSDLKAVITLVTYRRPTG